MYLSPSLFLAFAAICNFWDFTNSFHLHNNERRPIFGSATFYVGNKIVMSSENDHNVGKLTSSGSKIIRTLQSSSTLASQTFRFVRESSIFLSKSPVRLRYVLAMGTRFAYFLGQNVEMRRRDKVVDDTIQKSLKELFEVLLRKEDRSMTARSTLNNTTEKDADDGNIISYSFQEIVSLLQEEILQIENGVYKFPYDLDPSLAPDQWNPVRVAEMFSKYVEERTLIQSRRSRKDGTEVSRKFSSSKYPKYYLQNFHYQTDGWLSSHSATLYDYLVESLFFGTADAMRRQILPSIVDFLCAKDPSQVKLLDIASGTGRFISFVLDNFPTLDATVLDLSPFYLEQARKTLHRYKQVKFAEAAAECLPFPDSSFDAVTCVYLFHELPAHIRVEVVKEIRRILKPDGKLFFVDSAQKGERMDRILYGFPTAFHEPYYTNYIENDVQELFKESGFETESLKLGFMTKCLTLTKTSQPAKLQNEGMDKIFSDEKGASLT